MKFERNCGTCTKCCEGWLSGEALGHNFDLGKPCHFVSVGNGCSVYAKRPKDPCVTFKCEWLNNYDLPEWFKPDQINAIVKIEHINNIHYWAVIEAGEILQSRVLSWLIQYSIRNQINLAWYIEGGINWLGSPEFHQAMLDFPINKSLHSKPIRLLPVVEAE